MDGVVETKRRRLIKIEPGKRVEKEKGGEKRDRGSKERQGPRSVPGQTSAERTETEALARGGRREEGPLRPFTDSHRNVQRGGESRVRSTDVRSCPKCDGTGTRQFFLVGLITPPARPHY